MFVITLGPGNVDLTIPATMVLAATISIKTMDGDPAMIPIGLALTIAVGVLVGVANYALIRLLRIPPIIATLSSSFIILSIAIVLEPRAAHQAARRSWATSRAPTSSACRSSRCSSSGSRRSCTSCSTGPGTGDR